MIQGKPLYPFVKLGNRSRCGQLTTFCVTFGKGHQKVQLVKTTFIVSYESYLLLILLQYKILTLNLKQKNKSFVTLIGMKKIDPFDSSSVSSLTPKFALELSTQYIFRKF